MESFHDSPTLETRRNVGHNIIGTSISNFNEAQTLIKQQLTQVKLLTNDNQIKSQQVEILKEKIREVDEFNMIYKKQIENLEHKLKLYDQELTLKIHTNQEKCQKYQNSNLALIRRNDELQNALLVSEKKRQIAEEQIFEISREFQEVKIQNQDNSENLEKLKQKLRKREEESKSTRTLNDELTKELSEAQQQLKTTIGEKDRLVRLNDDNERQLKKVSNVQKSYKELQQKYEIEHAEIRNLHSSLDQMKKKYDELFYDYNLLVLNKRNEEEENMLRQTINDLEIALHETREEKRNKEHEINVLKEHLIDAESGMKNQQIVFDNDIKKVISLLDGKTEQKPVDLEFNQGRSFHALIEDILAFNKEQNRMEKRIQELVYEVGNAREANVKIRDERDDLEIHLDEQKKQSETILLKLNMTLNESHVKANESQMMWDQKIEEIIHTTRHNEDRLRAVAKEKDEEIERLRNILNEQVGSINALEEEKSKAYEFLREQEREVKDFKLRFKQIAEETTVCKSRVNVCIYLIADLIKLFFNLHTKYEALMYQKAILLPVLQGYLKIRNQFNVERKGQTPNRKRKYYLYLNFRKIVNVVIAMNRLRNLGLRNIQVKTIDLEAIRSAVPGLNDQQIGFYHGLFKLNTFAIDKNFLNRIFDSVCRTFMDDEYGLLFEMLHVGLQLRRFSFEKSGAGSGLLLKADAMNTLNAVSKLVEESSTLSTKLAQKEKEVQDLHADNMLNKTRADEDVDQIALQLKDVLEENERIIKEREVVADDYEVARRQIESLLKVMEDRKANGDAARELKESVLRDNITDLVQQLNLLSKYVDDLQTENESKNLRIMQLQKQVLNSSNYSIGDENWKELNNSKVFERSTVENKVPGKILYSSSSKRDARQDKVLQ